MVNWDDKAPYEFLRYFRFHSGKHEILCSAAIKRLKFKEVGIDEIFPQANCSLFPKRVEMYRRRYFQGREIGTLFCRKRSSGLWFLKDGNHRFNALAGAGVTRFRIAYDPKGEI